MSHGDISPASSQTVRHHDASVTSVEVLGRKAPALDADRRGFLGRLAASAVALAASVFAVARIAEAGSCPYCGSEQCGCCLCHNHSANCFNDCAQNNFCFWEWNGCYECIDPFGGDCSADEFDCSWCGYAVCSYGDRCV